MTFQIGGNRGLGPKLNHFEAVPRHNIYEEVELVVFGDCHSNVISLKRSPFVVLIFSQFIHEVKYLHLTCLYVKE